MTNAETTDGAPLAADTLDPEDRFRRLEGISFYLRTLEPSDLDFYLADEMDRVIALFEGASASDTPQSTREDREKEWKNIRRFLRQIDGRVSDREMFRDYAYETFDREWNRSSPKKRRDNIERRLLEDRNDGKANRLKNYALNLAAVTSDDDDYESKKNRIIDAIASDKNFAFLLSEYTTALDDYGFTESEEVRTICDQMIDVLRDRLLKSSPATPESRGDSQSSRPSPEPTRAPTASSTREPETAPTRIDDNLEADEESGDATRGSDGYYPIDEELARAAQKANSFREYKPGSATREYRSAVDSAREIARRQKEKVKKRFHEKIDQILDAYERRLASWYDRYHRNAASCPSVIVSGPDNLPREKHAQKVRRTGELLREHEKITELMKALQSVGLDGISAEDEKALAMLKEKLERLKQRHEDMKAANRYRRSKGSWSGYDGPLADEINDDGDERCQFFNLPKSLAEIHRIDRRVKAIERQRRVEYGGGWKFDGGVVRANKSENRLQIFFKEAPSNEIRAELRDRGFRWSPHNQAWQRILTPLAIYATKQLSFIPKDWDPKKEEEDDA